MELASGEAISLVLRICAIGAFISTAEYLRNPRQLADDGLMSWSVSRFDRPELAGGPVGSVAHAVLRYPRVLPLLVARLTVLAVIVLIPAPLERIPVLVVGAALLTLAPMARTRYGHNGADQMTFLIFAGAAVALTAGGKLAESAFLWFVAIQVCLSYGTAGLAKLSASGWRDGSLFAGILGVRMFCAPAVTRWARRHVAFVRWGARGVIGWECAALIILVLPLPGALAMLALGFLFHAGTAVMMGLNDFFWAFTATYPAVLYCLAVRGW